MPQLFADCLNEVFEYLDDVDLRSCLLVDRFWCEVTLPILWRHVQNYNTLVTCLPNGSRQLLLGHSIIISTKPPTFNYVSFVKEIYLNEVVKRHETLGELNDNQLRLVIIELLKMIMNQTTLKTIRL